MMFGPALVLCVALSGACYGWRDPFTGQRHCRPAPKAIASWSRPGFAHTREDHANLAAWASAHPDRVNAQFGGECATALHTASRLGREDIAAILLAHGANPVADDESGSTALSMAAMYGQAAVVKILLA